MIIAVLGSGNGGCAVAADCALNGHEVRLFDFEKFPQNIEAINKLGGIEASGDVDGFASLSYAGHDIAKAVKNAELVYVVAPSYATKALAEAYRPVMEDGQNIIVCPGTNGGALVFKQELGIPFDDKRIIVSETSTLPYACRILSPGSIHVYLKLKQGLYLATLPSSFSQEITDKISDVYPCTSAYSNVFQTILQNGNNVIHPAVSLLNVARIESPDDFYFYEDGVTEGVGRLMQAVDLERIAIADALDAPILSEPEVGYIQGYMLEKNYDTGYSKAPGFKGIKAQTQLDNRYFTEDVGYGLLLLTELGRVVGVATPTMDAIITLVSTVMGRDFRTENAISLEKLGLGGLDRDGLLKAVS